MVDEEVTTFEEVLRTISSRSEGAWLYLPSDKKWNLRSKSAILPSEEVSPELEDEPDAGVPEFARVNNLIQVLPVSTVQDIIMNARAQRRDATMDDLFRAFRYYHEHDAFIDFERRG